MRSFVAILATVVVMECCHSVLAFISTPQEERAKSRAIGHHSLHPPHLRESFGAEDIPNWSMSGTTVATDHYIRLTPDRQSSVGMLWNTEPMDLPAWEMVLGFRVHSKSGYGADGMALWIVDDIPTNKGSLFGHPSEFHGIGILFDSYDNDRYRDNPAVHVLYNAVGETKQFNPQQDFRGQSSGTCFFDYRNTPKPTLATTRLRFQDGTLQVYVSKFSEHEEVLCATVQGLDMSKGTYFVGFTAETGGITDHHDIHYLHVYPVAGVQYDHDVYEHQGFSHAAEAQEKHYWRAKSEEELAAEKQAQEAAAAERRAERERQRKEAEEANERESERRRAEALEKETAEVRNQANDGDTASDRQQPADAQQQQPNESGGTEAEANDVASEDNGAAASDVGDDAQSGSAGQAQEQPPQQQQQRPRVPVRQRQQPLRQPPGRKPTPPRRKQS